jgi:hypothetical protein
MRGVPAQARGLWQEGRHCFAARAIFSAWTAGVHAVYDTPHLPAGWSVVFELCKPLRAAWLCAQPAERSPDCTLLLLLVCCRGLSAHPSTRTSLQQPAVGGDGSWELLWSSSAPNADRAVHQDAIELGGYLCVCFERSQLVQAAK